MILTNALKKIPHLFLISSLAKKRQINIWLVGGFLRDIYFQPKADSRLPSGTAPQAKKKNKKLTDFDFCVESNVISIVKEFAKKISSKFIVLDESQGAYRVILKKKGKIYTYDFTALRGKDFCDDLSLRDFSINTLAVNLNKRGRKLIDCFTARGDLRRKIIRIIKEEVLAQDPLRILRGFSFMALLGFRIEKKTQKLMCKFKKFLENISGERVNEELFKILSCRRSYPVIKKMDELRIIDEIIPYIDEARGVSQGGYHHLDVWSHSLETLRQFELFYRKKLVRNSEILSYLNEELAQGRQRIQIVKLACILHDIGKSFARQKKGKKTIFHTHEKIGRDLAGIIAHKLRLSLREKEVLKKLIYWHLRPGYLADQAVPSQRAIYHFFRDAEDEGVGVILVSLSDWRATRGPLIDLKKRKKHEKVMLKLIDYYFQEKKRVPLHKIVDGYDIMKKFNLTPGPLIGKILKKIKEEQALGKISAKREAYKIAKTHLHLRGASGGAREEK